MRRKLRCSLLIGCLLALLLLLCACSSTNRPAPETGGPATSTTGTQGNQAVVMQPATTATTDAGSVPPAEKNKPEGAPVGIDACSLITGKEVAQTQGSAIKETKASQRNEGEFLMSQCFYTAEEFVSSVSLTVIQPNPAKPDKQPREYFTEKFREAGKQSDRTSEKEREREREKGTGRKEAEKPQTGGGREEGEEEEEEATAERVGGIGEQAFWVKTGPSASLYVLKNNQFLILSIGGGDAEPVKLRKTRTLAQQALKRLK